jgi:tRNA threonylcarbamoyladenosine biosynthesis protein TsaB
VNDVWLILETSGRTRVGLAVGGAIVAAEDLGGGRQHNRQLIPAIERTLRTHGLAPRQLAGVAVGVGPGSYTGLRVGLTAAKTLAYVVGCSLAAVPSFAAVAADVPGEAFVIGDALQGTIYVQRFANGVAVSDLGIDRFDDWVNAFPSGVTVAGPGLTVYGDRLPAGVTRSAVTEPSVEAVFRVAKTLTPLLRDELMRLEPLYLRGSSAEEKAKRG